MLVLDRKWPRIPGAAGVMGAGRDEVGLRSSRICSAASISNVVSGSSPGSAEASHCRYDRDKVGETGISVDSDAEKDA